MDVPAPVSPENTVKPGSNWISAWSTMTKSRICRVRSMWLLVLVRRPGHVVPVQLSAQGREKAVTHWMDEAHGVWRAAHVDAVAGLAVGPGLHVEVHAGARFHPAQGGDRHGQGTAVGDDDRPVRQGLRCDGHKYDSLDPGMQDGAVGR